LGWGSGCLDKGKGIAFDELVRCEMGDGDRSNSPVSVPHCLEMEVFSEKEPFPLKSCPPSVNKKKAGVKSSAWLLQIVKDIRHIVEISCEGFDEELMALFMAIDASNIQRNYTLVPIWFIRKIES
jgi:hypothetical protein